MTELGRRPYCTGTFHDVARPEDLDERRLCADCRSQPLVQDQWGRFRLRSEMQQCVACKCWFSLRPRERGITRRCQTCWRMGRGALQAYGFKSHLYSQLRNSHLLPEDIALLSYAQRRSIRGLSDWALEPLDRAIPYSPVPASPSFIQDLADLADRGVLPV